MLIIKGKVLKIILVLLIIFIVFFGFKIPEKIEKLMYKKDYSEYVEKYAKEYNVDKNLIYAVIKAESNFKTDANSSKNAIGLMQLMKNTALEVSKQIDMDILEEEIENKLLDPEININIGTKYLSILIEKYENIEVAVTAYNAGTGTVDNWIKNEVIKSDGSDIENIPYKETNNYVRKILRDYKIYIAIG